MVGRRSGFLFGGPRPIFRGKNAVSFREFLHPVLTLVLISPGGLGWIETRPIFGTFLCSCRGWGSYRGSEVMPGMPKKIYESKQPGLKYPGPGMCWKLKTCILGRVSDPMAKCIFLGWDPSGDILRVGHGIAYPVRRCQWFHWRC